MKSEHHKVGFVYVLTNVAMPDLVKVGLTHNLPEERAGALFSTGVPVAFKVDFRAVTSWPRQVEKRAHEILNQYRYNKAREFFQVDVQEAIAAIRHALVEAGGINSWPSQKPQVLRSGDRVSLALREGDLFAHIGFRDSTCFAAGKADILDLWQAHADGDMLEIYAAESLSHVAGLSDHDPGSIDDPVPFLDREQSVVNGMINGRERISPGERLVWVPAPDNAGDQHYVVFEANDYCQVVSRTWSPVIGPHAFPLLLNDFMHTDVWPTASNGINKALSLPAPQEWKPREAHNQLERLAGTQPREAHYWLPQLEVHRKRT
jgi:hypothetical protein